MLARRRRRPARGSAGHVWISDVAGCGDDRHLAVSWWHAFKLPRVQEPQNASTFFVFRCQQGFTTGRLRGVFCCLLFA
jgi:hypothetical protein